MFLPEHLLECLRNKVIIVLFSSTGCSYSFCPIVLWKWKDMDYGTRGATGEGGGAGGARPLPEFHTLAVRKCLLIEAQHILHLDSGHALSHSSYHKYTFAPHSKLPSCAQVRDTLEVSRFSSSRHTRSIVSIYVSLTIFLLSTVLKCWEGKISYARLFTCPE